MEPASGQAGAGTEKGGKKKKRTRDAGERVDFPVTLMRGPWTGCTEAGRGGSASGDGSCVSAGPTGRPYQSSSWLPLTPSSAPSFPFASLLLCCCSLRCAFFYLFIWALFYFPRARKRAPKSHHAPRSSRCRFRPATSAEAPHPHLAPSPTQNHARAAPHTLLHLHIPPHP